MPEVTTVERPHFTVFKVSLSLSRNLSVCKDRFEEPVQLSKGVVGCSMSREREQKFRPAKSSRAYVAAATDLHAQLESYDWILCKGRRSMTRTGSGLDDGKRERERKFGRG